MSGLGMPPGLCPSQPPAKQTWEVRCRRTPLNLELLLLGHGHWQAPHEEGLPLLSDLVPVVIGAEPADVVLLL